MRKVKIMKIIVSVMWASFLLFLLVLMGCAVFAGNETAIKWLTTKDILVIPLIITFIVPNTYMFYKIMKNDD